MRNVGGEVLVEAPFVVERRCADAPPTLWFALPAGFEPSAGHATDGVAVALLPLAMHLGEPVTVRGRLSGRLAEGMREYQRLQAAWKPDFFSEVEIRCDGLERRDPAAVSGGAGASFSGGVDSFYTLWARLEENEPCPPARMTHCVMINGFDDDADLDDRGSFRRIAALYRPMLTAHGIELVVVRTNLLGILGNPVRRQSFGAFLTAPALLLGGRLARFYVPSGSKFTSLGLYPDGSHLMLDHMLSTESMETVHADAHLSRFDKTVALARWPETFDRLRVCFHATGVRPDRDAIANCCACEKCLRTMVTLELCGALQSYGCFPLPLERSRLRSAEYLPAGTWIFAREIIAHARQAGRNDIVRDIRRAMLTSVCFRQPIRRAVAASNRLRQRSPRLYSRLVAPFKRIVKRTGWARGWLY